MPSPILKSYNVQIKASTNTGTSEFKVSSKSELLSGQKDRVKKAVLNALDELVRVATLYFGEKTVREHVDARINLVNAWRSQNPNVEFKVEQ